jgi:ABC-type uncharacterized transport system substrate-binding protein
MQATHCHVSVWRVPRFCRIGWSKEGRTEVMMKRFCSAVFISMAGIVPASSHPHLFATVETNVITTPAGLISGLRIRWNFDETYTQFSLEGLDLNKDGVYSSDEIAPLTKENISSLLESKYFTSALSGGKEIAQAPVTVYGQDMIDAKLSLWFELPFATPVDPKAGLFEARIYDPDFFIAFDYLPEKPPKLEGALPAGCVMTLKPLPTTEELDQTRDMLAEKPKDWQPDQPTDFGAMFAQPLTVACS